MASKLERRESAGAELRRIVRAQLRRARESLERTEDRDEAIHDARRTLKKARAVLRLARKGLGSKRYRKENRRLRDAARPLTEVRDAKVLVDALDELATREALPARKLAAERRVLLDRRREIETRVMSSDALEVSSSELRHARRRVRRWELRAGGWSTLGAGIDRIYRAGRNALALGEEDPTIENLHELRKQVKYLRNALTVLQPVADERMRALADELGVVLGDDHDLAVLKTQVGADALLSSRIDRRRRALQRRALPLARKLYARAPKSFLRELRRAWREWRQ